MSTASQRAARARPNRALQVAIWLLFLAALAGGWSLSTYGQAASSAPAPPARAAAAAGVAPLSLAPAGLVQGSGSDPALLAQYASNPDGLLPAYRWGNTVALPSDLSWNEKIESTSSAIASMLFSLASFIWGLLLGLVKFAIGMDIVGPAAIAIDTAFAQASTSLLGAGLGTLAVIWAVVWAATRGSRGQLGKAVSAIIGAVLVVGALTFATTKSQDTANSHQVAVGSPAWIALRGESFVNDTVGTVATGFGTSTAVTASIQDGTAGTGVQKGGATCETYVKLLYADYAAATAAKNAGGKGVETSKLEASALSMISFMWQRGMYDNYTLAAVGDLSDGGRIACHQLEKAAKISATEQFAVVGGHGVDGSATADGYGGMASGPFYGFVDAKKDDQAAMFAWAACGGSNGTTARPGWKDAGQLGPEQCTNWYTWKPKPEDFTKMGSGTYAVGSGGINKAGENSLKWGDLGALEQSTSPRNDDAAQTAALQEVNTVVTAYYGHNGGQRVTASMFALISAGLYAAAFGIISLGTIAAQIGLLFMLLLLPFTLILLAIPNRDGGRNSTGVKMLRLTGSLFAGKAVFLALMVVAVQIMGILFMAATNMPGGGASAAGPEGVVLASGPSGQGFGIWSMVIPLATIFILRGLTKMLGLGNLLSVKGAAGFATSAALSGKSNQGARSAMQAKLNGTLSPKSAAGRAAGFAKRKTIGEASNRAKRALGSSRLRDAVRNGWVDPQDIDKIGSGPKQLSLAQAERLHKARQANGLLPPEQQLGNHDLLRIAKGEISQRGARNLHEAVEDAKGGWAGFSEAAANLGTATGAADVGGVPVFGNDLAGRVDAGPLQSEQLQAQRDFDVRNKNASSATWEANADAALVDNVDAMRAAAQGVPVGVTLSDGQVAVARAAAAAAAGVREANILMGTSGLPPVIAPARIDDAGRFDWNVVDATDAEVLQLALNPLNYLHTEQFLDENDSRYHLRVLTEGQAAGVVDDVGNLSDQIETMLRAQGVDVATASGRQLVIDTVRGESTSLRLEDLKIDLPVATRQRVNRFAQDHFPTAAEERIRGFIQDAAEVESVTQRAAFRVTGFTDRFAAAASSLSNASPSNSAAYAARFEQLIKMAERQSTELYDELAAVASRAELTTKLTAGAVQGVFPDVAAAAAEIEARGRASVAHFASELAEAVAGAKFASRSHQQDHVNNIAQLLRERLDMVSKRAQENAKSLSLQLEQEVRTQAQHAAGQARTPNRGKDYAAGASEL